MVKGLLAGSTLGVLLGGTAAIGTALLFPAPASNQPPAAPQVEAPVVSSEPGGAGDVAALDVVDDRPNVDDAPDATTPQTPVAQPDADSAPLDAPVISGVEGALAAPEAAATPELSLSDDAPVLPNPQSIAPQAPAAEAEIEIATAPATPEPRMEDQITVEVDTAAASEIADADAAQEDVADAPVISDTNPSAQTTAPTVISIVTEDGQIMPQGDSSVQVNRPVTEEADADAADDTAVAEVDPNAPALVKYGASFDNPDGKPLLSLVLHDRGEMPTPLTSLSQFDFPVTVVVDLANADAIARVAEYRNAGLEVAVMTTLPEGATPSDIEVILTGLFDRLPEGVALIDTGETGLQGNRDTIEQTMAALAGDGRGLLTIARGLNTALRTAQEAGVPATTIYRDIDPEWQSARIVRRFLDQAAFRARQQSGVVLFGRLRPNTLTGIKQWSKSSRAEQVAMAPLSAVLLDDAN